MAFHARRWVLLAIAVLVLWLGGCTTAPSTDGQSQPGASGTEETANVTPTPTADMTAGLPTLMGEATVEMRINGGRVVMSLDGDDAPVTAGNFVDLVNRGVYGGLVFHRVVREPQPFVVQGGDPQSKDPSFPAQRLGTGSFIDPQTNSPRYIPLEIKPQSADQPLYNQTFEMAGISEPPALSHTRGAVAMARSQLVDSASSQFYIALSDLPFLDGSYAVFGYVQEGMEVVDQIQQGDRIESMTVLEGVDNLQTAS